MKHRHRRRREDAFATRHHDFAEALTEASAAQSSASRQWERKARQLSHQVQRALNLALAARGGSLADLYVEEVAAAPAGGPLLVHVVIPEDRRVSEVLTELHAAAGVLRSEVAQAITRKRAPELVFVPALLDGGGHA